ncbi:MAG: hypothetical protein GY757_27160, partial [bacterium]|nr:hypothetical protein [bacterium]
MKKLQFVTILAVVFLISTMMPLMADGHGHGHKAKCSVKAAGCHSGASMCCDITKCIPDLTDGQKAKIKAMSVDCKKKMIDLKAELKKAQIDMKAICGEFPDQKKMDAKIDAVAKLKTQVHKARYACVLKVRSVLNDKQKANMKTKMGKCGSKCGSHAKHACKSKCDSKAKQACKSKCDSKAKQACKSKCDSNAK